MKNSIIVVASIFALTSFSTQAETWQCLDGDDNAYSASQNVPSDFCIESSTIDKVKLNAKKAEYKKSFRRKLPLTRGIEKFN
jgi:hypothetical protein